MGFRIIPVGCFLERLPFSMLDTFGFSVEPKNFFKRLMTAEKGKLIKESLAYVM